MKRVKRMITAGSLVMGLWAAVPLMPAIAAPAYTVQTTKNIKAKIKIGMNAQNVTDNLGRPLRKTTKVMVYCIKENNGCRGMMWINFTDGKVTEITDKYVSKPGMQG